jgi:hypothetical protein
MTADSRPAAGHDLQRTDAPLPELEAFMRVIACAAALVRTAAPAAYRHDGGLSRVVASTVFDRLAAALEAAGIGSDTEAT